MAKSLHESSEILCATLTHKNGNYLDAMTGVENNLGNIWSSIGSWTKSWNDAVTKVSVRPGCFFAGYDNNNLRKNLMEVDNIESDENKEWEANAKEVRMTSYTCFCGNLCARLYEHPDFEGDYLPIGEGDVSDVRTKFTKKWNDKVSSIKVESNCVFKPYRDPDYEPRTDKGFRLKGENKRIDALGKYKKKQRTVDFEDKITGWKCHCNK